MSSTPPSPEFVSRFESVSRRHFLQRSAMVGGLGVLALVPGVACSDDDEDALSGLPTATGEAGSTEGSMVDGGASTTQVTLPADPFPAGAEVQVNFTFATADERPRSPYIAVWIEDASGSLVQTVALWFRRNQSKYLNHLTRWYDAESTLLNDGGTDNLDAIAGATRAAGSYQVVWDGTDVDGRVVPKGNYVLCIEAAREDGPYGLATGPLTIGADDFTTTLADNGELSAMVVAFVV